RAARIDQDAEPFDLDDLVVIGRLIEAEVVGEAVAPAGDDAHAEACVGAALALRDGSRTAGRALRDREHLLSGLVGHLVHDIAPCAYDTPPPSPASSSSPPAPRVVTTGRSPSVAPERST